MGIGWSKDIGSSESITQTPYGGMILGDQLGMIGEKTGTCKQHLGDYQGKAQSAGKKKNFESSWLFLCAPT